MTNSIAAHVRNFFSAVALAFVARAADARSEPTATRATARSAGDAVPTAPDGVPLDGALIIIGIVAVVILLAWVCSRVSDSR